MRCQANLIAFGAHPETDEANVANLWKVSGPSRWLQRLLDRAQPRLAQGPFAPWSSSQKLGKARMHDHHYADQGVETTRTGDVAVVSTPEDLQPCVHPLHRRATVVQSLELLRCPRNRWEAPQVDCLLHPHGLAVDLARIAHFIVRTSPAFMPRRTAILERLALRFVTDVGHGMPHDGLARAVVAMHRAGLVVDNVRRAVMAGKHLFGLALP